MFPVILFCRGALEILRSPRQSKSVFKNFFCRFGIFWVVVGRCGSLWVVVGRCGSFWVRCGSLWMLWVVCRFGWFLVLVIASHSHVKCAVTFLCPGDVFVK